MPRYNHAKIEPKWQAFWDENQTFATLRMPKPGTKKLYVHDDKNELNPGDRVRVQETRPMSKLKRWRLVEVVERAK